MTYYILENKSVTIITDGNVWVQNPDGIWRNVGAAEDMMGSGNASGRKGKDKRGVIHEKV